MPFWEEIEKLGGGLEDALSDPLTLIVAGAQIYAGNYAGAATTIGLSASSRYLAAQQEYNLDAITGTDVMTRSPISPRSIVYGRTKVSGPILFLETTNANQKLHIVVALAGHEIDAVEEVYFNDVKVAENLSDGTEVSADSGTTPNYSAKAKITAHFGSSTQTVDANLQSRTSIGGTDHMKGIAYIYCQLEYDKDVFATGLPNISAVIRGKKVAGISGGSKTSATWTTDPARIILDYIQDSTYGLNASDSEVDLTSFEAASDICVRQIYSETYSQNEDTYSANGVVDTSKDPQRILEDLLTSCSAKLVYSNGRFKLIVDPIDDNITTINTAITPSLSLGMDEFIKGFNVQTRNAGSNQYNAIKGTFVDAANNYQPTDFPSQTSATFETEDNSERTFTDISYPFTTSASTAQRMARTALYRHREQIVLDVACNLKGFSVDVGDFVSVSIPRLGFTNKTFEVLAWSFSANPDDVSVSMTLREISADVFFWTPLVDETVFTSNNTNLPLISSVSASGTTGAAISGQIINDATVDTPQVASNAINDVLSSTAAQVTSGGVYVTAPFVTTDENAREAINAGNFPTDFVTGPTVSFTVPSTNVPDRLMLQIIFTGYNVQMSQSTPTSTGGNYDLVLTDHSLAIQTLFNGTQKSLVAHDAHTFFCLGGFPQQVVSAGASPRILFFEKGTDYNGGETMQIKFFLHFYEEIAGNMKVAYNTAYIQCYLSEIKR
jgi:hypothetical protein